MKERPVLLLSLFALLTACGGGVSPDTPEPPPEPAPPPPPQPTEPFTVLHTFSGGADGANPYGLVRDASGNLYGVTLSHGDMSCSDAQDGCGTVFKVDAGGAFTTVHRFAGGTADGASPRSGLVVDAAGNVYGSTFVGGEHDAGVVFRIDPAGTETILYHSTGRDGGIAPQVGVVDPAGTVYGTSGISGRGRECRKDCGTVFQVAPTGTQTTLHEFSGIDGDEPSGPVIADDGFNLFGATAFGGGELNCPNRKGCGTVFKQIPGDAFTRLHRFSGPDGETPSGSLARDANGNLYGVTLAGGSGLAGVVYKVDTNATLTVLLAFNNGSSHQGGKTPVGGVVLGTLPTLYGTTSLGGTSGEGVIFALNANTGEETVLHTFEAESGGNPQGPLVADGAGNLFGTGFTGGDLTCKPPDGCGVLFRFALP